MTSSELVVHANKGRILGNRVMLLLSKLKPIVTANGIIVRETAQKRSLLATVIATGPGLRCSDGSYIPMEVEPGDVVIFNKFTAYDIECDGDDYIIVQEDDILLKGLEGSNVVQFSEGLL